MPTDQDYIDRLAGHYGDGLFEDEIAHLPEHSIELEVVLLQYLYEGQRPIRIVPLLVGSFQDCIFEQRPPASRPDVRRMVAALRHAEGETKEPICYLISGDLDIGPKFGDPEPVDRGQLVHSRGAIEAIFAMPKRPTRRRISRPSPRRTIAGAFAGCHPRTLSWRRFGRSGGGRYTTDSTRHPEGYESVSFASVAFYE